MRLLGLLGSAHGFDVPLPDTAGQALAHAFGRSVAATGIDLLDADALDRGALIPHTLSGYATDVVDGDRGELAPTAQPVVAAPSGWGYGTPLYTESGAWGTVACSARAATSSPPTSSPPSPP